MKKSLLTLFSILSIVAFVAISKTDRVVQIFRGGEVIQQYKATDIDYIEVNEYLYAPEDISATINDNTITVTWSEVDGATYNLYRSADNVDYTLLAAELTENRYVDQHPLSGANYYKVKAVEDDFESVYSQVAHAILKQEVTFDFTYIEGIANGDYVTDFEKDGVTLSFSQNGNANGPKWYNTSSSIRMYGMNQLKVKADKTIETVTFTYASDYYSFYAGTKNNAPVVDPGTIVENGNEGVWTIGATEGTLTVGGTSGHVRIKSITVIIREDNSINSVPTPDNIISKASDSEITVAWSEVEGATYNLYRSADNVDYTLISAELTENRYVDQNPLEGTNYYKVKAVIKNIESDYSSVAHAVFKSNTINGHEFVDLGLGNVLWATCNIGASNPTEFGDRFSWGNIEAKSNAINTEMIMDFQGNSEYDAARAIWGGTWEMPSKGDIEWLIDNCHWDWKIIDGIRGYLITGPNGNQIFIPFADITGYSASYWSTTHAPSDDYYAIALNLDNNNFNWCAQHCESFLYIRPISQKPSTSPLSPTGIVATRKDNMINISWSNIEGATYNLYRSADNVDYTLIAADLTENKYVDQNPLNGANYYKVKAVVKDVESNFSTEAYGYLGLPTGTIGGHDYIDLGLPSGLKWATYNVGATKPEEYGDYFAWGETKAKSTYTESNCKTNSMSFTEISGNPEYDAVTANWGEVWRMPTKDEMQELYDNCIWEWKKTNGVNGYLVTGPNGNQIFFPAAGFRNYSSLDTAGHFGYYWSSTPDGSQSAYFLIFCNDGRTVDSIVRYFGHSVRAVSSGDADPVLKPAELKWTAENGSEVTEMTVKFGEESYALPVIAKDTDAAISVTSSAPEIADWNSETNTITIKKPGTTVFTATCPTTDDYGAGEVSFTLVVESEEDWTVSGTIGSYEYVDLGLPSGLKWATCNVGANSPEEYGDYFAWGETTPKSEYTEENCKTWEKDMGDISGNPEYDAATANWGGTWRIPTQPEMQELMDKCIWLWTTRNGVNGYLVTGSNGNQIFLPAAGCRSGSSFDGAYENGFYRCSTPYDSQYTYVLDFDYGYWDVRYDWFGFREVGFSVRAVSSGEKPALKPSNLKWIDENGSEITKMTVKFGEEPYALPVISKDTDAAVSVASSAPEVAEWDNETNTIIVKKPGTAVFTATCPATNGYAVGKSLFILNVFKASANSQFHSYYIQYPYDGEKNQMSDLQLVNIICGDWNKVPTVTLKPGATATFTNNETDEMITASCTVVTDFNDNNVFYFNFPSFPSNGSWTFELPAGSLVCEDGSQSPLYTNTYVLNDPALDPIR